MTIIDHPVRHAYAGVMRDVTPGSDVVSALAQCNLLWGVTKAEVRAVLPDGRDPIVIPGRAAILRDMGPLEEPVPLAVVGSGYVPITNVDAFGPLQLLVDAGKIEVEQGGMTKDGRHTFLLCSLADGVTMLDRDPHARFILAKTSHDGTGALRLSAWSQRLFCTNQMPSIIAAKNAFVSIHHGRGAALKVEALSDRLDMLIGSLDTFDEEWRVLASQHVTTHQVDAFITRMFPTPPGGFAGDRQRNNVLRNRTALADVIDSRTNENLRGTKAALVAAATEWDQHYRGQSAARRSTRLLEGGGTRVAQRAWALAGAL